MASLNIFRDENYEKSLVTKLDTILTDVTTVLANNRDMIQEIKTLRETVAGLSGTIAHLENELKSMKDKLNTMNAPVNRSVQTNVASQRQPMPAAEPPKPATRTFYATALIGDESLLHEVPENKRGSALFKVTANGDRAKVEFNSECVSYCLISPESRLIPFFDYEIQTNPPSMVIPQNTVNARQRGENWVLDGKIKIILR